MLLLITGVSLLSGCSYVLELSGLNSEPDPVSFEFYISHPTTVTVEYEQYKLLPIGLFAECGEVAQGRYDSKSSRIVSLSDDERATLEGTAGELFTYLREGQKVRLGPPGSSDRPGDPGKFLIALRSSNGRVDVRTSLDTVQRSSNQVTLLMRKLTKNVTRAVGKPLCPGRAFFF